MPELTEGKAQLATQVDQDVKEAIARLAKLEGVSQGDLIGIAVRAYDAEPEVMTDAPELPDNASVAILIPRDKDMFVDAIGNLIASCKAHVHPDDIWKGFVWARHEFQKTLPEFKSAERMRAEHQARREAAVRPLEYTKKGPSLK